MSRRNPIFSLPSSLTSTVLIEWIDFKDVVRLDSAYCCKSQRNQLVDLLKSPENVFTPSREVYKQTRKAIQWMVTKSLKVSFVLFDGDHSISDSQMFNTFLTLSGKSFKRVYFDQFCFIGIPFPRILEAIIDHAPNITNLRLFYSAQQLPTTHLISRLSKLEDLTIIGGHKTIIPFIKPKKNKKKGTTGQAETEVKIIPEEVILPTLPLLRSLSLSSCDFSTQFDEKSLTRIVKLGPNLVHLELLQIVNIDIVSAIRHCPHLRALSLPHTETLHGDLPDLAEHCPHIAHLGLVSFWVGGNSSSLVSLFGRLPLQTLCVDHASLSDTVIGSITALSDTLTTLHMVHTTGHSDIAVYLRVFKRCAKLHTLAVLSADLLDLYVHTTGGYSANSAVTESGDCGDSEVYDITSMHHITTLTLQSDGYTFSETALSVVHYLCPKLTTLYVYSAKDTVMAALAETVQNCKRLHTLYVPRISDVRVLELQRINPALKVCVVAEEARYCYDMKSYI